MSGLFIHQPEPVAGLLAAGSVLYAAFGLPRPSWRQFRWLAVGLAGFVVLKLLAGAAAAPVGLKASYWAAPTPSGGPERSSDFAWLRDATRIDTSLDLRGEDFAVHFFNDAARFNAGPDAMPGRDQLPFSVRWEGWLLAEAAGARRFVVENDGPARLRLDEAEISDTAVDVAAGLHTLQVDYTRPEAKVPRLRVSWQRLPGGRLETVATPDVRWRPSNASPVVGQALDIAADVAVAGAIVAWLALGLAQLRSGGQARALLGAVPLLFGLYGVLLEAPAAGRATILSGLDDWLVYESSARDILLNGLRMDGGLGHAPPFYGQPLYPYVLALAHQLAGESLFGPIVLQFAALGLVVVGTAILANRAFGTRLAGLAALASLLVLVQLEPEHFKIARQLFNENLYMPLVMASLIVLAGLARRRAPPVWWQALLVGILLGLTAITRSQFLLSVPFALAILLLAWRRAPGQATLKAALVVVGIAIAVAPITARNWLVSGQFVPISSAAGASLLEFHRPPPGLIDQAALQKDPLFEALHLDQQTRTVLAFIRADPRGYLASLTRPLAHSIGLQGRNDSGIYWPLLCTVLLYLASLALPRTRELHVWPIHAFVVTHLSILMLFEADTYGYRLVMPMYAPMVAVAAQVPLALIGYAVYPLVRLRSLPPCGVRRLTLAAPRNPKRAMRYAGLGWTALIVAAIAWQAKGVIEVWPQRETALHGLGGPAAHAALAADQTSASVIYVASVDGTPRRFGAGSLPGLRYPWFKWFDPVRSLPLPAPTSTAVYMLSELNGASRPGDLTRCLGSPAAASDEVVITGERARQLCLEAPTTTPIATFSFAGLARIDAVQVPQTAAAGEALEARLLWQPLILHPEPQQISLQLDDPAAADGTQWGNGTLDVYPARQWQPDESVLSRVPVSTDPTAIPQEYRLTLGMGPTRANAPPATATWHGAPTDRVPVAAVTLTPGSPPLGQALPADMRPVDGSPLVGSGLELIGMRPLPSEASVGSPLRVGLLWRAVRDEPSATEVKMRLVRGSGEVVQESVMPVLGGRVKPSALHAGNIVRDEQRLVIGPRVPIEPLALELVPGSGSSTGDASVRLGSINLTGRAHVFDSSGAQPIAMFGGALQLLSGQLDPGEVRAGEKLSVRLRWRSNGEVDQAYKVFVHVLDQAGQRVIAQRDTEPQDGHAPTTSWVIGEVLDDEYALSLPTGLPGGNYPVEIGVYDPRSGDRLRLENGENRWVLKAPLKVTP